MTLTFSEKLEKSKSWLWLFLKIKKSQSHDFDLTWLFDFRNKSGLHQLIFEVFPRAENPSFLNNKELWIHMDPKWIKCVKNEKTTIIERIFVIWLNKLFSRVFKKKAKITFGCFLLLENISLLSEEQGNLSSMTTLRHFPNSQNRKWKMP